MHKPCLFFCLVLGVHDTMPVTCASTGCNNKFVKGSEIRFYRFPLSKPSLSAKWVQNLGLRNFIPTANTCLCSEHFSPDCFRDYNGKQFLREDAVPTVFPTGQDFSKIELRKRATMPLPKDSSITNYMGPQAERDKAREVSSVRREKRGSSRGGRGGRGGKQLSDRQSLGGKSRVYDSKAHANVDLSAAVTGSGFTSRWRWKEERSSATSLLFSKARLHQRMLGTKTCSFQQFSYTRLLGV
ncbi:ARL14 effector protein isoform X2 [Phycodurus eques]|uniref:ARL14 effector protein isoform X2 n=1 Tax=Phycodurus eques TaxID=693459 RepID=UPI002ACED7B0|nr:ARL14 effector protein isoform X2 [Phycodurus eques]